jgi:uncharacterized protein (DUF1499 family)
MKTLPLLLMFMLNPAFALSERFAPCPDKPNCVSSRLIPTSDRYIGPMEADISIIKRLKNYIQQQERWKLISETRNYLHATAESKFFGFIDDVEFIYEQGKLHMRSASRLGYYDFGVNRKRLEQVKESLK